MQRASAANVAASERAAEALRTGVLNADDPQFAIDDNDFAPVQNVRVIGDGETLSVGNVHLPAHFTPGHTPGTLSYTFTVLDRGKPVNVAYSGGTAFNFVNNTPDPGLKNFQT